MISTRTLPSISFNADNDTVQITDRHGRDITDRLQIKSISFGWAVEDKFSKTRMVILASEWMVSSDGANSATFQIRHKENLYDLNDGLEITEIKQLFHGFNEPVRLELVFDSQWGP